MAQLAIRGHKTRGKEVIEILKMLGGVNTHKLCGDAKYCYFTIDSDNKIKAGIYVDGNESFSTFSLEEFFKKFPYKVGDKVIFTKYGDNDVVTIESMSWTGATIEYNYNSGASCLAKDLQPYKVKENLEQITLDIPDGYEFFGIDDDNKVVLIKKHIQYPKTYEECCKIMNYCYNSMTTKTTHKEGLIRKFQFLLLYRDAYWKIAGEQMRLNKSWEPENPTKHYIFTIETCCGDIIRNAITNKWKNRILVFPTKEMRNAFYENFKELIEQCKELL